MNSSTINSTYETLIEDAAVIDYLNEFGLVTPTTSECGLLPLLRSGKDAIFAIQEDSPGVRAFQSLLAYEHLNRSGTGVPPLTLIAAGAESKDLLLTQLRAMKLPARDCAYISDEEEIAIGTPQEVQNFLESDGGRARQLKRTLVIDIQTAEISETRSLVSGLAKSRKRSPIIVLSRLDENVAIEICKGILAGIGAKISHKYFEVGPELLDKPKALCDFVEGEGLPRTVVFCNLPSDADLIEAMLRKRGIAAKKLIGNVPQARFNQAMAQSKSKEVVALIATEVSAKLLEPGEFDLVINYTIPSDAEVYSRRTTSGGSGNLKKAINLVGPLDKTNLHYLRKILDVEIEQINLPTSDSITSAKLTNLRGFLERSSEVVDDRIREIASLILKGSEDRYGVDSNTVGTVSESKDTDAERMVAFLLSNFFQYAMPVLTNVSESGGDEDRGRGRRDRRDRGDGGRSEGGREERSDRHRDERDAARGARGMPERRRDERRDDTKVGLRGSRGRRDESEGTSLEDNAGGESQRRGGAIRGPIKRSERIYVGRGFQDGFGTSMAETAAGAGSANLNEGPEAIQIPVERISVRDYYSFIDIEEPYGDLFIQRLQPVLGEEAVVRKAVALNHPRPTERDSDDRSSEEFSDSDSQSQERNPQDMWSEPTESGFSETRFTSEGSSSERGSSTEEAEDLADSRTPVEVV